MKGMLRKESVPGFWFSVLVARRGQTGRVVSRHLKHLHLLEILVLSGSMNRRSRQGRRLLRCQSFQRSKAAL